MIASRRRAHRILIFALAPLAVLTLVAAIVSRRPAPLTRPLPNFAHEAGSHRLDATSGSRAEGASRGTLVWERIVSFTDWPVRMRGYSNRAIELEPIRPINLPDVLVYWTPFSTAGRSAASVMARLPADAHLLGRVSATRPRTYFLPDHGGPAASTSGGAIVLYSLGRQEVVGLAALGTIE